MLTVIFVGLVEFKTSIFGMHFQTPFITTLKGFKNAASDPFLLLVSQPCPEFHRRTR